MTKVELFASAVLALQAAASLHGDAKAEAKEHGQTVAEAQRVASWAAFDAVMDAAEDEREALASDYGTQIGNARGVGNVAEYAKRGRDMVRFATAIANDGAVHTLQKGKRKGEQVNGRDNKDALTLAKRYAQQERDNAAAKEAKAAQAKALATVMPQAKDEASGELGITVAELDAMLMLGGDDANDAAQLIRETAERIVAAQAESAKLREALDTLVNADMSEIIAHVPNFGDALAVLFETYRTTIFDASVKEALAA